MPNARDKKAQPFRLHPPVKSVASQAARGFALMPDDLQILKRAFQAHGPSNAARAIAVIDAGRVSGHPYITSAARALLALKWETEDEFIARMTREELDQRAKEAGGGFFAVRDDDE